MADDELEPDEFPLAEGAVFGFRRWVFGEDGLLYSTGQIRADPWRDGVNEAECMDVRFKAPPEPRRPDLPEHPDDGWKERFRFATGNVSALQAQDGGRTLFGLPVLPDLRAVSLNDSKAEPYDPSEAFEAQRERELRRYAAEMERYQLEMRLYEDHLRIWHENMAKHGEEFRDHLPPNKKCKCGFYMVNAFSKIPSSRGPNLVGVVKGYGRIVKYEDGWRFQKGEIVALAPSVLADSEPYTHIVHSAEWGTLAFFNAAATGAEATIEEMREKIERHYPQATFHETEQDLFHEWGAGVEV